MSERVTSRKMCSRPNPQPRSNPVTAKWTTATGRSDHSAIATGRGIAPRAGLVQLEGMNENGRGRVLLELLGGTVRVALPHTLVAPS